jgi:hypothetical protein
MRWAVREIYERLFVDRAATHLWMRMRQDTEQLFIGRFGIGFTIRHDLVPWSVKRCEGSVWLLEREVDPTNLFSDWFIY